MATSLSPGGRLGPALSVTGGLIAEVRDEQWSAPTPCTDWTVRDLVNHLVGANSGAAVQAAFEQPGVLERTYQAPIGRVPGAVMLDLRITDLLVHAWDLAQATGQLAELPDDLVEQALAFARAQLADVPRAGRFGPAQPVAQGAPALDRLVAYLGRPVRASE